MRGDLIKRYYVAEIIISITTGNNFLFNPCVPVLFLLAVYSYLTSKLVGKVMGRATAVGTEALIGIKCTTTTPLLPDGYVRVGTELWRARSVSGDIDVEAEVVIVGIKRLTLFVKPSTDTSSDEGQRITLRTDVSCQTKTTATESRNQERAPKYFYRGLELCARL